MTIDWGALAIVAVVSLATGVLVVVLVSFALVGLSARQLSPTGKAVDETAAVSRRQSRLTPTAGAVTAALCLLGAAAVVLYGFYVLVL
jgi:hypothetical protein